MKEYAGEMSDEEMATDRWENEGGHTELARAAEEAIAGLIAEHVAAAILRRQSNRRRRPERRRQT
jgi:hypothetical protein